jgi:hypothetical protein
MSGTHGLPALPRPLGQNPFRLRGHLYRSATTWLASRAGSKLAMLDAMPDEAHRIFFAQSFVPSEWYDLFGVVGLNQAGARVLGIMPDDYVRMRTRIQAEADLRGMYRAALRIASPDLAARYLPVLAAQIFDHGRVDVCRLDRRSVEAIRHGTPQLLEPWYRIAVCEYLSAALSASGARGVRVEADPALPGPVVEGTETVSVRLLLSWARS